MTCYFIDYENVMDSGLRGADLLGEEDKVILFYSDKVKKISFEAHIACSRSKARFEYIKIGKVGKNYLDFQLSTYLGYVIAEEKPEKTVIVTRDMGYTSVVDFWNERGVCVVRQNAISPKNEKAAAVKTLPAASEEVKEEKQESRKETRIVSARHTRDLPEAWRKKVRDAVKEEKLPPVKYTLIYKAIAGSKNKLELNNCLVKEFRSEKGGSVYGCVKNIYEQYQAVSTGQPADE